MAWTAPRTWVVGELVTAAFMNIHIRDNFLYLQTFEQNDVTGARDIAATIYRNLDDWIRIVTINVRLQVDDDGGGDMIGDASVTIHCDAATPPVTQIAIEENKVTLQTGLFAAGDDVTMRRTITFVVLPLFYYKATSANAGSGAAPGLLDWFEWNPA